MPVQQLWDRRWRVGLPQGGSWHDAWHTMVDSSEEASMVDSGKQVDVRADTKNENDGLGMETTRWEARKTLAKRMLA